jgi:hypothetical protein
MYSSHESLWVSKMLMLRILVFWLLTPCNRVVSSVSKVHIAFIYKNEEFMKTPATFRMKAVHSFISKMSVLNSLGDKLWAGWSRDKIPMGARFSTPIQAGPEAHPASCAMGNRFLSWC